MKKNTYFFIALCICFGLNTAIGNSMASMESFVGRDNKKLPAAKSGGSGDDIYTTVCNLSGDYNEDGCLETDYDHRNFSLTGLYNITVDFNTNVSCTDELYSMTVVIFDENNNVIGASSVFDAEENCTLVPLTSSNSCNFATMVSSNLFIPISLPLGCDNAEGYKTIPIRVELMLQLENGGSYTPIEEYFNPFEQSVYTCLDEIFPPGCFTGPGIEFSYEEDLCFECYTEETAPEYPFDPSDNPFDPFNEFGGQKRMAAPTYENSVLINPNPFNNVLNLTVNSTVVEEAVVQVFNIQGQLIMNQVMVLTQGRNQLDLITSDFQAGSYIVKVNAPHLSKVMKIVKSE